MIDSTTAISAQNVVALTIRTFVAKSAPWCLSMLLNLFWTHSGAEYGAGALIPP